MGNDIVVAGEKQYPLTAMAVVARVRLIQEVMQNVMKKDTHYGVIPGCAKPSLWKPGAEQLLVTFRIAPDEPKVEDLSTGDNIRYRVTRTGISNGVVVAAGVGECSSDEEKYKWRTPVCDAEYEATPEDRRRLKWKRDGTSFKQVRTNPADVANTILKMADKRAFIAMTLLATAASDIFTQDLEDLPPEVAEAVAGAEVREPIKPPVAKAAASEGGNTVSFVPSEVEEKSSAPDAEKKWTKWGVKLPDGTFAGTFNEEFGFSLIEARDKKNTVNLTWKQDGKYKTITALTA